MKQVNRKSYGRVAFDFFPGRHHFRRPVNVVEHEYTSIMGLFEARRKISYRGLLPVVGVEKSEVERSYFVQRGRQGFVQIALHRADVPEAHLGKVVLGNGQGLGATLESIHDHLGVGSG